MSRGEEELMPLMKGVSKTKADHAIHSSWEGSMSRVWHKMVKFDAWSGLLRIPRQSMSFRDKEINLKILSMQPQKQNNQLVY